MRDAAAAVTERARRVQGLWNWLPTFRVAAEVEHVTRAAERLGVSPSAVSRMVALLEGDVGQPLFDRAGRNLVLNAAGEHLLGGIRNAMRLIDESLSVVGGQQFVGPVSIAVEEPFGAAFLWSTLQFVGDDHPQLVPRVKRLGAIDARNALLRGELDVAFVRDLRLTKDLTVHRLAELPTSACVGRGHPLFEAAGRRVAFTDLADYRHVEVGDGRTRGQTGWPMHHARRVTAFVQDYDLALSAVESGGYIGVLPDVLSEDGVRRGATRRLSLRDEKRKGLPPVTIYVAWREQLTVPGRVEVVVEAAERASSATTSR